MTIVPPTVKDVARAVVRLDEYASTGESDIVNIDGENWTGLDLRISVANNLAYRYHIGLGKHTHRVTLPEVRAMLAIAGAAPFTIEQHARAIASLIRSDYRY